MMDKNDRIERAKNGLEGAMIPTNGSTDAGRDSYAAARFGAPRPIEPGDWQECDARGIPLRQSPTAEFERRGSRTAWWGEWAHGIPHRIPARPFLTDAPETKCAVLVGGPYDGNMFLVPSESFHLTLQDPATGSEAGYTRRDRDGRPDEPMRFFADGYGIEIEAGGQAPAGLLGSGERGDERVHVERPEG